MRGKPADGPSASRGSWRLYPRGRCLTRQTDLLLDQIEIVEQPGLCRHDTLPRRRCGGDDVVCRQQNARVVRQSRQQAVRSRARIDLVLSG
jgi:hypothetical protein